MEHVKPETPFVHPPRERSIKVSESCHPAQNRDAGKISEAYKKRTAVYRSLRVVLSEVHDAECHAQRDGNGREKREPSLNPLHNLVMRENKISQDERGKIKPEPVDYDYRRVQNLRRAPDQNGKQYDDDHRSFCADVPEPVFLNSAD